MQSSEAPNLGQIDGVQSDLVLIGLSVSLPYHRRLPPLSR
jgi:hypothetical protein